MAIAPGYRKILEVFKSKKKHYLRFLRSLTKLKNAELDSLFWVTHQETFNELNCLECGNCCRTTSPVFKSGDIQRLAQHVKIKTDKFITDYLKIDEDHDFVLQGSPCPFLGDDNYCSVYEARPRACRDYPHTNHRKMHNHLHLAQKNGAICPAVMEILDRIEGNLK